MKNQENIDCSVCTEIFNKSTRKEVECLHCGYKACQKCVRRFLLENTIRPKCMSCNTEWNMEFMRLKMSKSFMEKEYKNHQKEALQVEAETHLGEYQADVVAMIKVEELRKEEKRLMEEKKKIEDALYKVRREIGRYAIRRNYGRVEPQLNETPREFFMACPSIECRGRLSTAYKCGLCLHYFCPDCHVNKGLTRDNPDHECKKDDLDTVKLLKENTRPCPSCHMGIFKTQGCHQMWCTQCHTCFSWVTGKVLNGAVHNPHFYEWQRRQNGGTAPRVQGDIPCGGMMSTFQLNQALYRTNGNDEYKEASSLLRNLHRIMIHMQDNTLRSVRNKFENRNNRQREIAIRYLRKQISKEEWVELLYRESKQREKYRRYYQVLETLLFNGMEIYRQFLYSNITPLVAKENCEQILSFANTEIIKINRQYNGSLTTISPDMDTTRF